MGQRGKKAAQGDTVELGSKRPYVKPGLRRLGSVRELTQSKSKAK